MPNRCDIDLTPFFDLLLEGVQVLSPDLVYLYVNRTVANHGKKEIAELVGRPMKEVYPGIEETPLYHLILECIRTQKPERFENKFSFEDGSIGWFELILQPHTLGILILSIDITD